MYLKTLCSAQYELPVSRVLSWTVIYLDALLPIRSSRPSKLCVEQTTLLSALQRMGFTWQQVSPSARWALTPPFHPYLHSRRFISVALSLRSPSAAVSRHPALRCSDFPHGISIPRNRLDNSQIYNRLFYY